MADSSVGDPVELGTWLFDHGVSVVQLRAKGATTATRTRMARALMPVARAHGAVLLVNDDVEAARASGAHGVHLGQDDGPVQAARARLGPAAIVGRSTHTLAQVRAVAEVDYIGFGPVFSTRTKHTGWSPRGPALLAQAVAASVVPVVAIGGITPDNLPAVSAAGAAGWAVVGGLWGAPDRAAALSLLASHRDP